MQFSQAIENDTYIVVVVFVEVVVDAAVVDVVEAAVVVVFEAIVVVEDAEVVDEVVLVVVVVESSGHSLSAITTSKLSSKAEAATINKNARAMQRAVFFSKLSTSFLPAATT